MRGGRTAWTFLVCWTSAGCGSAGEQSAGGESSGAKCEDAFDACQGNLVGDWTVDGSCATEQAFERCPEAIVQYRSFETNGRYAFGANGELTVNVSSEFEQRLPMPRSCVGGITCAEFELTLEEASGVAGVSVHNEATCTDAGDVCDCDISGTRSESATGTYRFDGPVVILSTPGGGASRYDYCARNERLSLRFGAARTFLRR